MLKSMTGFGRSEKQNGTYSCKAEIRSVNNRFIEVSTRLPKYLSSIELPLKKHVKSRCSRGSFDVFITLETQEGAVAQEIKPNLDLATQYHNAFTEIQTRLGLAGNIEIGALLSLRDIVKTEAPTFDEAKQEMVMDAVDGAMDELILMREQEGQSLKQDLTERADAIEACMEKIQARQPEVLRSYRERLHEKIKALSEGIEIDENRLAQETAIMADKCDIAEELTRLKSHLEQFRELIQLSEPIGRKLEFLTQEINRETNTIGSKSIDQPVSQLVIEIKSTLEKVREQLQNIE